jgi:hypothetical protein
VPRIFLLVGITFITLLQFALAENPGLQGNRMKIVNHEEQLL